MWNDIGQRIQRATNLQIRIEAQFAPELYVSILVAQALAASLWMLDSRRYSFLDGTTRVDM
jgi:hypothetical protein